MPSISLAKICLPGRRAEYFFEPRHKSFTDLQMKHLEERLVTNADAWLVDLGDTPSNERLLPNPNRTDEVEEWSVGVDAQTVWDWANRRINGFSWADEDD